MALVHDEGWVYLSSWPKFGQVCLRGRYHHLKVKPIILFSYVATIVRSLTTLRASNVNIGPKKLANGLQNNNFLVSFVTFHLNNYWIL
jgi:hypothetical protein